MGKITVTCNKCGKKASTESVEVMNAWWEAHTCGQAGGIIGQDTSGLLPDHQCTQPGHGFPLGVIWECGECKRTFRMESVRDRGISQNEWVPWTSTPINPSNPHGEP